MKRTSRVVVIDNYDSFTFNLVQRLGELGARSTVVRNDAVDVAGLRRLRPDRLIVSPGPCTPDQAGISVEAIRAFSGEVPVLGVCLGHQSVGQAFGGRIVRATEPVHGKASAIVHDGSGLFEGVELPFEAGRYHSLIVERRSLPGVLIECAWVKQGGRRGPIMAVRHREHPVFGVQFHPESILTPGGTGLLRNFLRV